jgi:DNA-binding CsgD family transcriptional regulator
VQGGKIVSNRGYWRISQMGYVSSVFEVFSFDARMVWVASFDFGKIERAFADAALDPGKWNGAMDATASAIGALGALLLPVVGSRIPEVPTSASLGEVNEVYFREKWFERDERSKGIPLLMKRGLIDDLDVFGPNYIKDHPYYQDFLSSFRLRWFAGIRVSCGDDVWCLSIQRTIDQGPFSKTEKIELMRLSHTLSTSAALAKAIGFAASSAALEALEASGSPALLIDRQGEVFRMNYAAEKLLGGEIRIVNRRLVARDQKSTAAFDRALHDLLWDRVDAGLSKPVVLNRTRQYPLIANVIRPSSLYANAFADCKAIAILIDLGALGSIPEAVLQDAFRLTEAEARLATRLGAGMALEAIADELCLSKETVRFQLKAIFAKTATHRQGELVALISSLAIRSI